MRAVTNDCHSVGNLRHFIKLVRDIYASHALRFKVFNQIKQNPRFGCSQCRGWLVKDQKLGVLVDRFCDLNQLLLTAGIMINGERNIDIVDLKTCEQLRRPRIHLIVIDEATIGWLGTQKDVLSH